MGVAIYEDSRGYVISWRIYLQINLEGQTQNSVIPACIFLEEKRGEKCGNLMQIMHNSILHGILQGVSQNRDVLNLGK